MVVQIRLPLVYTMPSSVCSVFSPGGMKSPVCERNECTKSGFHLEKYVWGGSSSWLKLVLSLRTETSKAYRVIWLFIYFLLLFFNLILDVLCVTQIILHNFLSSI